MTKTGMTEKELPNRTIEEIEAFRDDLRDKAHRGLFNASTRIYSLEWANRLDAYLATRKPTEA